MTMNRRHFSASPRSLLSMIVVLACVPTLHAATLQPSKQEKPPVNDPVVDVKKQAQQPRPGQATPDTKPEKKATPEAPKDTPKTAPNDAAKNAPAATPKDAAKPAAPTTPPTPPAPSAQVPAASPATTPKPATPPAPDHAAAAPTIEPKPIVPRPATPPKTADAAPTSEPARAPQPASPKKADSSTIETVRAAIVTEGIRGQITRTDGVIQCRQLAPNTNVAPGSWRDVTSGESLQGLIEFRAGPKSTGQIKLADGTLVSLTPLARVKIQTLRATDDDAPSATRVVVSLQRGRIEITPPSGRTVSVTNEKTLVLIRERAEVGLDSNGIYTRVPE